MAPTQEMWDAVDSLGSFGKMSDYDVVNLCYLKKSSMGLKMRAATADGRGAEITAIDRVLPTEGKLTNGAKLYSVNGQVTTPPTGVESSTNRPPSPRSAPRRGRLSSSIPCRQVLLGMEYKQVLRSLKSAPRPIELVFLAPHTCPHTGGPMRESHHDDHPGHPDVH